MCRGSQPSGRGSSAWRHRSYVTISDHIFRQYDIRGLAATELTPEVSEGVGRAYGTMARERLGITGDILLELLETRLDNVVYRLSFADSRRQARQMVTHGHFRVNGRKMDIPSYLVRQGDIIEWKYGNGSTPEFVGLLTEGLPKRPVPSWLALDTSNLTGTVAAMPDASEVDMGIDVRLIVEFYSK